MKLRFNLILTTYRNREDDAERELTDVLKERAIESSSEITEITGIVKFYVDVDPIKVIDIVRKIVKDEPWQIRFILRLIPIYHVVDTNINGIVETIQKEKETIDINETYRVTVEKRHSNIDSQELIKKIAEGIERKVDLDRPDKIILIEILAKYSGISIIKSRDIFSCVKEKREI